MKHYTISLLLFLTTSFFAASAQNHTRISGKIKNAPQNAMTLYHVDSFQELVKYEVKPNAKGEYQVVLPLDQAYYIIHFVNKYFFVRPKDQLIINFDYDTPETSIRVQGTCAKENTFLLEYQQRFSVMNELMPMTQLEVSDFCSHIDKIDTEKQAFYEKARLTSSFSKEFEHYLSNAIILQSAFRKMTYVDLYGFYREGKVLDLPEGYYKFIEALPKEDESLLHHPDYYYFLSGIVSLAVRELGKFKDKNTPPSNYLQDTYKVVELLYRNQQKEFMQANIIKNALRSASWGIAEEMYQKHLKEQPNNPYNAGLSAIYEKAKQFATGQAAPDFVLEDAQGKRFSLKDFRGKLVYIDFWASWCGPCIKGFPYAKKLKEELKALQLDAEVVFLYISVDTYKENWLEAVDKYQMEGIHLIDSEVAKIKDISTTLGKAYQLRGIPHYMLIDREGRFIEYKAPHPESVLPLIQQKIKE